MDETAAAASALVIAFAGDVSLRAGAVELTRLANNVARAADPVGIPSYGLLEAAEKLWHADDATRENLVQALEAKATILKGEATSRQNNLRQSVASLVHESLKSPLPCTGGVLALSDKVWYATSGLRVHRDALGEAREAIAKVGEDAAARTQALAELVKAATELEEAAGPRLAALVRGAANLALACQEHTRVADAIPVVRRAAEHRRRTAEAAIARQGGTARTWWWRAWWPWNRRVGRGNGTPGDLEKALLVNETESTPTAKQNQEHHKGATAQREGDKGGQLEEAACLGKGDERRSPMLGFAIYGTYALLSSVSPITGKTLRTLSSDVLWHIHIWVTMWWTILLIGSGWSSHGHCWWELLIAKIATRIGIFGINMMFIFFSYWVLDIEDKNVFYLLPSIATVLHLVFLFMTCRR